MSEFESPWRNFVSTKFDTPLDCFRCPDERGRAEAMCGYCGKSLDQMSTLFGSQSPEA
jgi:hypothetical protein